MRAPATLEQQLEIASRIGTAHHKAADAWRHYGHLMAQQMVLVLAGQPADNTRRACALALHRANQADKEALKVGLDALSNLTGATAAVTDKGVGLLTDKGDLFALLNDDGSLRCPVHGAECPDDDEGPPDDE